MLGVENAAANPRADRGCIRESLENIVVEYSKTMLNPVKSLMASYFCFWILSSIHFQISRYEKYHLCVEMPNDVWSCRFSRFRVVVEQMDRQPDYVIERVILGTEVLVDNTKY